MKDKVNQVKKYIDHHKIEYIDLKFIDLMGKMRHVSIPAENFSESTMKNGVGFDGSSVGYRKVESGDMCLIPDLDTLFLDPCWDHPTISIFCNIVEADSKKHFIGDPRSIVQNAIDSLTESKIGKSFEILPELEFSIFDSVAYWDRPDSSGRKLQCQESHIESDDIDNPIAGYCIRKQNGYHCEAPGDAYREIRSEIVSYLKNLGVKIKYHHHEVGAAGQQEIELAMSPALKACDQTMLVKYFAKNICSDEELSVTFMPKPIGGEAGNGMHMHMRLLDQNGQPGFFDDSDELGLSDIAYYFIGGIIFHGRSLAAFTNPSVNSYRRLINGFEAPTKLFFSHGSRNAAIRIPKYATSPNEKRFEIRFPDATCNVYFAIAAVIMAGIDGIKNQTHARKLRWGPFSDIKEAKNDQNSPIISLPESLEEALISLENDHEYLKYNSVFSQALINAWIQSKRDLEINPLKDRPTPGEFELYFNC